MIEIHGLQALVSFVGFAALFILYGLVLSKIWIVPARAFDAPQFYSKWRQIHDESLLILSGASLVLLLVRTSELTDGAFPGSFVDVPAVLTNTHFGMVWSIHILMLVLVWVVSRRLLTSQPSRAWSRIMIAALVVIAFTYSASSHASNGGDFTYSEMNDCLHVISAAVWGGSIIVAGLLVFPQLRQDPSLLTVAAHRLSTISAIALVVVLGTGIENSVIELRTFNTLTTTTYGRVLLVKLAFVAILVFIGGLNRLAIQSMAKHYILRDTSVVDARAQLVARALTVDAVVVFLVLTIVSFLIQIEIR